MSARAIEAAKAFVKVGWEDSALRRGISSAMSTIKGFASGIAKVGIGTLFAQGINAATRAVFDFVEAGAAIDDIANRTGASTEGLSQLAYAADQSGASIQDIEKAMRKLADVETEAARGGSAAAKSLSRVGLSAKDLDGLSPEEKFLAISEGLSKIQDPAERSSLAMDLLGKSGANLLPMMEDGAAGIQAMMAEADSLGMTLGPEQAKAAADFDDAWNKAIGTLAGFGKIIGAMVLPYVTSFINLLLQAIPYVLQFGRHLGNAIVEGAAAAWSAISELLNGFDPLFAAFESYKTYLKTMAGLLVSGEFKKAAEFFWLSLKAAWLTGIDGLNREWLIWKKAFLDTFNDAMEAVTRAWYKTQNYLSKGVVEVMAVFDSTIDVNAVNAELDDMLGAQLEATQQQADADQAARDALFENNISAVNQDLETARTEWQAAVAQANQAAEKAANDPSAASIADNKFTKLIQDLATGDIATRINDTVKGANNAVGDVRSVAGAGQLTSLINRTGQVNQQMLTWLQVIARNTEAGTMPQVVNI
jgi:methyl-accepting chemotaxis protein